MCGYFVVVVAVAGGLQSIEIDPRRLFYAATFRVARVDIFFGG